MAIFSHLGPSSIFPGQIAREAAFGPGHDLASKVVVAVKNLPASAGDKRYRFDPWFGRRAWQPTSVFLPGEYWSGLPFPSPGDLPNPGIELSSLT